MNEKPKETPKEELECPKKYVYDTGIIFECKDNIRVEIIGEDVVDLLNELATKCSKLEKKNEQLKQRCKELRNDLIDHSALIKMLENTKALKIEDMIWNTMDYKIQIEFDDDFADYRKDAKKRWKK